MTENQARTIQDVRDQQNARAKRWQQAQRDQGKKHLTVLVSADIHKLVASVRDETGQTNAEIVEQALTMAYGGVPLVDPSSLGGPLPGVDLIQATPADDIDQGIDDGQDGDEGNGIAPAEDNPVDTTAIDADSPNYKDQDLSQEERDRILIQVNQDYPGYNNAQKRVDVLNQMELVCGRGITPWDAVKVGSNYRAALKRQKRAAGE